MPRGPSAPSSPAWPSRSPEPSAVRNAQTNAAADVSVQGDMDLKYALRRLVKNPVFFATACVSLALGIGANTAAFSVVYAVLLRSLPVQDPASLAVVSTKGTGFQYSMSYPAYTYLRDHSSSLDGLVAFRARRVTSPRPLPSWSTGPRASMIMLSTNAVSSCRNRRQGREDCCSESRRKGRLPDHRTHICRRAMTGSTCIARRAGSLRQQQIVGWRTLALQTAERLFS
jgi:hypothetical protein